MLQIEAPVLFNDHDEAHCYVRKQPENPAELDAMVASAFSCIRYRGRDLEIIQRIIQLGEDAQCDLPPAEQS